MATVGRGQTATFSQYSGKVLIQRQFVGGPHPVYDADGKVLSGEVGPWTTNAEIQVRDVVVQGNSLLIQGRRLLLLYDDGTKQFRDLFDVLDDPASAQRLIQRLPEGKQLQDLRDQRPVTIEIRGAGAWDDAATSSAIQRVFLGPQDNLSDVVPDMWKPFLCQMETLSGRIAPCLAPASALRATFRVGGGVTAPRVIAAPDPPYSELARQARFQGRCVLWVVVNAEGRVTNIRVAHPTGLGLDEKAAAAVNQWVFQPATKDGQPVNVQINVEVNFRLY